MYTGPRRFVKEEVEAIYNDMWDIIEKSTRLSIPVKKEILTFLNVIMLKIKNKLDSHEVEEILDIKRDFDDIDGTIANFESLISSSVKNALAIQTSADPRIINAGLPERTLIVKIHEIVRKVFYVYERNPENLTRWIATWMRKRGDSNFTLKDPETITEGAQPVQIYEGGKRRKRSSMRVRRRRHRKTHRRARPPM